MADIIHGSSTGKNREYHQSIGDSLGLGNSLSDEGKNIWQKSYARINSVESDFRYIVNIEREDIQVPAILGFTPRWWAGNGYPSVGNMVKVEHKKDYFNARIVEVIDKELMDDFTKSNPKNRVTLTNAALFNAEHKRIGTLTEAVLTVEGYQVKSTGSQ